MSITTIFYIFQTRTDTLCVRVSFLYMPRLEEHQRKNGSVDKYWGTETKTEKTAFWRCQCFAPVVSDVAYLISSKPHKPQTKGTVLLVCLWHIQTKRTVPLVCGLRLRLESATPHHQRRPPQRGRWHRQKDKNHSPSAKNRSSKIRVSESTNKMIPEFFLHWQM